MMEGAQTHPEFPLNRLAHKQCDKWGSHFYGGINDTQAVIHMDGRSRKGMNPDFTGIILEAYYNGTNRDDGFGIRRGIEWMDLG